MTSAYMTLGSPHLDNPIAVAPDQLVRVTRSQACRCWPCCTRFRTKSATCRPPRFAPLARALNLSRAEVHGVITYYHHFRTSRPRPSPCNCAARKRAAAWAPKRSRSTSRRTPAAASTAGIGNGDAVELESVYCLGQCALSPAMMINGELYAKVTPQKFDALFAGRERNAWRKRHDAHLCSPRFVGARARRRRGRRTRSQTEAARARHRRQNWCATARAACCGSNRSSKWQTAEGRVGYANVEASDVGALFDAGFVDGGAHATPRRRGRRDSVSEEAAAPDVRAHRHHRSALASTITSRTAAIEGLRSALEMNGDAACEALIESGLRGRGGAAFPAGIKWRTVRGAQADAEVHRLQRGRRRLRHVLRPHA